MHALSTAMNIVTSFHALNGIGAKLHIDGHNNPLPHIVALITSQERSPQGLAWRYQNALHETNQPIDDAVWQCHKCKKRIDLARLHDLDPSLDEIELQKWERRRQTLKALRCALGAAITALHSTEEYHVTKSVGVVGRAVSTTILWSNR